MNYFDSAAENGILSVHYQIIGKRFFAET